GHIGAHFVRVWRVTIGATDVVSPMLAATEVIPLFLAGVAGKTSLGDFFRVLIRKRNDLGFVSAAIHVRLAWTVTRFAAGDFVFPAANRRQRRVRRVRVGFEDVLVTRLAGVTADVITGRLVVVT